MRKVVASLFLLFITFVCFAQNELRDIPYFSFGKGIGIASPDSMYLLNIRFRLQNRLGLTTNSTDDLSISEIEARVRRLRLRFDGFIFDPKITYVLQLSFARGDLDFEDTNFPNVVRDAMVFYAVNPRLTLGLGQTKLPGNRQRVVSSGDLQFPDRSIVNSRFNIDRDFGLQAFYKANIKNFFIIPRLALSTGEGRNVNATNTGLAYTARVEFLPMGLFAKNGDYFEGDLQREPKGKLSVGFTLNHNSGAKRTGGTIGKELFAPRDITTFMADFIYKRRGASLSGELMHRQAANAVTFNLDSTQRAFVITGLGVNLQGSYLFKSDWEIALRHGWYQPDAQIFALSQKQMQTSLGLSRYLRGHRLKVQTDLSYDVLTTELGSNARFIWRFQVEMGI